jgi:NADP-dependent 3-hydroxy acid dehydrogenase YdfG
LTNFHGQVAVITGAGTGIGAAIAQCLAEKGICLFLIGRRREKLEAVAESARKSCPRVICHPADVTSNMDIRELVQCLKRDYGFVDILVHSAGVISIGRFNEVPVEDFDRQYLTNVRAPFVLTQSLLPILIERRGQIVFINSSAGLTAGINVSQYAATKHALKALADSLRAEINPDGVRVLSIYAGRTASPMQATVHEMEKKAYHPARLMQPENVAEMVVSVLGMPRTAEVTDLTVRPMAKPL